MIHDVVYSCDDNGARFLAVSLYSLLHHYRGTDPLRVNILEAYGGLSAASKSTLRSIIDSANPHSSSRIPHPFSLRFIDIELILEPYRQLIKQREGSRWNIFAWIPVFGPDAVRDAEGNLLYLDIDTLVNEDVSVLFEMDLQSDERKLLAAVYENHLGNDAAGQGEWESGILPPEAECYFNDGVLVINAERFRQEKCLERILRWYSDNYDRAHRIEQDALNALFWDRVQPLSPRWNYHDRTVRKYCFKSMRTKRWDGNDPTRCLYAAIRPAILHFWGKKKPWNPSHRPYRRLYHLVMRKLGMKVPPEQPTWLFNDLINNLALECIGLRYAALILSGKARWGQKL